MYIDAFLHEQEDTVDQIDRDRFFTMALAHDRMAGILVPAYEAFQTTLLDYIRFLGFESFCVVDLGGGSGIFLERLLSQFPGARACWVDYSSDFHQVAIKRLSKFGKRVAYVIESFSGDWESKIQEAPDIIISMSAIHHLKDTDKAELYARCYKILEPGGWFFNVDEMKSVGEMAYRKSVEFWAWYVETESAAFLSSDINEQDRALCLQWLEKFESWKRRNIEQIHRQKQEGDDLHAPFADQLGMLEGCGFRDVDLFAKHHLWSMIGGCK